MKERAAVAIPRNSRRRRKVANARIDAILNTLIQESLRGGGEEAEEEATAEEGRLSAKRNGINGCAASCLLSNDVEEVITYVDRDQSGEVGVEVGACVVGLVVKGREGTGRDERYLGSVFGYT